MEMKYAKLKENEKLIFKIVDQSSHDEFKAYPLGGGLEFTLHRNDVILMSIDQLPNLILKPFWACLEDLSDDEPAMYPCIADPAHRKNGMPLPRFSKNVFEQVCKDTGYRVLLQLDEDHLIIVAEDFDDAYSFEDQNHCTVIDHHDGWFTITDWNFWLHDDQGKSVLRDGSTSHAGPKFLEAIQRKREQF